MDDCQSCPECKAENSIIQGNKKSAHVHMRVRFSALVPIPTHKPADEHEGHSMCTECGIVVDRQFISDASEWRTVQRYSVFLQAN